MTDTDKGLSAAQVAKQIDASLTRLRTDYVDLYQCHRYDPETPIEDTMEAPSQVITNGKERAIGLSAQAPAHSEAEIEQAPTNGKHDTDIAHVKERLVSDGKK